MNEKELYKKLTALGLPLFEVEDTHDVGAVFCQMVTSADLRLWEGFPVVLATANQNKLFDYSAVNNCLKNSEDKKNFSLLVLLSLALYGVLGLKFPWAKNMKTMAKGEKEFKVFLEKLKKDAEFNLGGKSISPDRLKSVFTSYFQGQQEQLHNLSRSKDDFGLEHALSQLFSSKQKELFLKKFRGEVLTKTEREYYSRCVKKKALALANSELHKMAQQLMGA